MDAVTDQDGRFTPAGLAPWTYALYPAYLGKGHEMDVGAEGLRQPSWHAPATLLAMGDHLCGGVQVLGRRSPTGPIIEIAAFDGIATATVTEP